MRLIRSKRSANSLWRTNSKRAEIAVLKYPTPYLYMEFLQLLCRRIANSRRFLTMRRCRLILNNTFFHLSYRGDRGFAVQGLRRTFGLSYISFDYKMLHEGMYIGFFQCAFLGFS